MNQFGWVKDPRGVERVMHQLPHPIFSDIWSQIKGSGKGKRALLYEHVIKVAGSFPNRKQKIGDCVSQGAAYAIDCIKAFDIVVNKEREIWVAETVTEDIYYGSRNIIGKGQLGNQDGSLGAWAAKYINDYGAIPRGKYNGVDLSEYSGERAKQWGNSTFKAPAEFTELVRQHPIQTVSRVSTYEEVRDLIYNGYAVTIASGQGFSSVRDGEGFARPEGSWQHQMCLIGVDDEYSRRPGVLVQNSWGTWNSGPKRHNQPDGSFWIEADVLERRILSDGDSWAISGYAGFKPKKRNVWIA